MFVVVWYDWLDESHVIYTGGSAGEAVAKFEFAERMGAPVEYQEWNDEGTLIHWKYRGRNHEDRLIY